ncbi:TetR/AcrR family transcriptional regulator [Morganella sp. GD04133]|uniref:TetR/AcrR family transcriptional regulator n=1 Tax=Morganella sp. GD04133 TaxID=2975435 RepID=UPI00244869ED|nr:TetR/AcrR family transcriptional regulator [Morganella sp. GD04133]MDH0354406.1 TetR/AcrR family transcriptional regulator [Morganella sp. GD04133]
MEKLTEKQQRKRRQILDAAMHCFIEKGFHSTSTAEICKAAAMSPGNQFHYYPTKYAIIEAIAELDEDDHKAILSMGDEPGCAADIIEKMITALIMLYSEPGYTRLSLEIITEASRNPALNTAFIANEQRLHAKFCDVLKRGITAGEIDPQLNASQTASWLLVMADGTLGRELMEPEFSREAFLSGLRVLLRKVLKP